ncbi:MAG TPA: hypothetical protein VFO73_15630 [Candidatus Limnocylindrales bacterium]|nr:hypothetical protein [Candidatus Limnocylindrales bacterium]
MSRTLRLAAATALLAVLALGSVATTTAGGPKLIDARMTGIPTANLVLQGVTGGGVPWVIDEGRAKLFTDGRLDVEVQGLVLATNGTNPIANGRAIVTCNSLPAASSPIVPFSPEGNASVTAQVDLPDSCLAPAVFFVGVLPTGAERWFAVTGL